MSGQGSFYQRKPGTECYFIYNTGETEIRNGKKVYLQKWVDLDTTDPKVAKDKIKLIRADLVKKGRYDEPSKETFGEWLDFWLEEIKRPRSKKGEPLKPNTYDDYEYTIRFHIKPKLGQVPLKKITPEMLQLFYNTKQKETKLGHKKDEKGNRLPSDTPLSSRTLQKIQMIIRASLQKAVSLKKIPENPDMLLDRINYKSPKAKYLPMDKIAEFLDNIKTDRWHFAYVTCFGGGFRLGELVALEWDDIDFKAWKIRIDQTVEIVKTHEKNGKKQRLHFDKPKTEESIRVVPVPKDVIVYLRLWRWRQKKEKAYAGKLWQHNNYVFTWDDGRLVSPEYLSKHFNKLAKKLGYEGITFHKQRHSYATMLLEKGENTRTIQENLGHASDQITQIYAHVIDEMKVRAAKKIEGFTKKKKTGS